MFVTKDINVCACEIKRYSFDTNMLFIHSLAYCQNAPCQTNQRCLKYKQLQISFKSHRTKFSFVITTLLEINL